MENEKTAIFDGPHLIKIARQAVFEYLSHHRLSITGEEKTIQRGVFVSIYQFNKGFRESLRGCVGFPISNKSVEQTIKEAAIHAATMDNRFVPLQLNEIDQTIFELSILSVPEDITCQDFSDYIKNVQAGKDGLMLRWRYGSGLLLPQVASEMNWDTQRFLSHLILKAGAPPEVYSMPDTKLFKFNVKIFKELTPNGRVINIE